MRTFFTVFAWLLLLAIASPASAQSAAPSPPAPAATPNDPLSQQLQDQLSQQQQIEAFKSELSGEVQTANDVEGSLKTLVTQEQQTIDTTVGQVATVEQKYLDAQTLAQKDHEKAVELRNQAAQDKKVLTQYIRQSYADHDKFTTYLLSSNNLSDYLSRSATLSNIEDRSAKLVDGINTEVKQADAAETSANAEAKEAGDLALQLSNRQAELNQEIATENDLIKKLDAQSSAAVQEIQQANAQDLSLVQQITQLRIQQLDQTIQEAENAVWQAAQFYVQNHLGEIPSAPPASPSGVRFIWPIAGATVSQGFGPSPYDFEPPFAGFPHFHTGIDLAAPMGTPVLAAGDGIVVEADQGNVGYGNHIVIAHDAATMTLYGHLETS